ncbi:MAG: hypothetical protein AB7E05_14300 [Sphingobium sp.]
MTLPAGWPGHRRKKLAIGMRKWPPSRAGGATAPIPIPGAIAITDFSARATLLGPVAAITDAATVDHPSGAETVLQIVTSANTTYIVTPAAALAEPVDVTDGYVQIPFRPVSYAENIGRWSIELHSAGTPAAPTANYHQLDPFGEGPSALKQILTSKNAGVAPGRWQVFQVHGSDFTAVGSGADLSAIKFARLTVRGNTGSTVTIQFGSIRFQPRVVQKAACVIYFDDGHTGTHDTALPLFQAKGFKGCFNLGAMLETLDVPGRMSTEQVSALVAAGWELHGQAYTSEDVAVIGAMTDEQRAAEMTGQQAVATSNGWGDNIVHGSYFSGVSQYELDLFPMFHGFCRSVRAYFSARGANPPMLYGESYPYADKWLIRSLSGDHSAEQLIAHCEQAVKNKGLAAFTFHGGLTSLPDLLDWLDAHRDEIEVVTEAQLNAREAPDDLGGAVPRVRRLTGGYSTLPNSAAGVTSTTQNSFNSTIRVVAQTDLYNVRPAYVGFMVGVTSEADLENEVTYRSQLLIGGEYFDFGTTFVEPGTILQEGERAYPFVAKGTEFHIRTYGTVPEGGKIHLTRQYRNADLGIQTEWGTDLDDKSGGGTIASQNIYQAGGFVGLMANIDTSHKSIVLTGDSLTNQGVGRGYYNSIGADWFMMGYSGAQLWLINNNYTKRAAFIEAAGFNVAVSNGGINDFNSGRTESQVRSAITNVTTKIRNAGVETLYFATICPGTDTTANPVTDDSQTTRTNLVDGRRQRVNASLRNGEFATVDGVAEWALAVENPGNDYFWIAGSSADGLHPNAAGEALINDLLISTDPLQ